MSAAEEVLACYLIAELNQSHNLAMNRLYNSGLLTADAVDLLDALDLGTKQWYNAGSLHPWGLLAEIRDGLDNYLAQKDETTIQLEVPKDASEPITFTSRLRSLLLVALTLGGLALTGCTTRPRITATGDVTYHTEQTITIGAAVEPGTVADLAPALGLARASARITNRGSLLR